MVPRGATRVTVSHLRQTKTTTPWKINMEYIQSTNLERKNDLPWWLIFQGATIGNIGGTFSPLPQPKNSPAAIVSYSETVATSKDGGRFAVVLVLWPRSSPGVPQRKVTFHNECMWPLQVQGKNTNGSNGHPGSQKKHTLTSGTMCPKPNHLPLSSPIFLYWLLLSKPSYLLAYTIIRVFFCMFMFYSDVYIGAYPYHASIREHLIYLSIYINYIIYYISNI